MLLAHLLPRLPAVRRVTWSCARCAPYKAIGIMQIHIPCFLAEGASKILTSQFFFTPINCCHLAAPKVLFDGFFNKMKENQQLNRICGYFTDLKCNDLLVLFLTLG